MFDPPDRWQPVLKACELLASEWQPPMPLLQEHADRAKRRLGERSPGRRAKLDADVKAAVGADCTRARLLSELGAEQCHDGDAQAALATFALAQQAFEACAVAGHKPVPLDAVKLELRQGRAHRYLEQWQQAERHALAALEHLHGGPPDRTLDSWVKSANALRDLAREELSARLAYRALTAAESDQPPTPPLARLVPAALRAPAGQRLGKQIDGALWQHLLKRFADPKQKNEPARLAMMHFLYRLQSYLQIELWSDRGGAMKSVLHDDILTVLSGLLTAVRTEPGWQQQGAAADLINPMLVSLDIFGGAGLTYGSTPLELPECFGPYRGRACARQEFIDRRISLAARALGQAAQGAALANLVRDAHALAVLLADRLVDLARVQRTLPEAQAKRQLPFAAATYKWVYSNGRTLVGSRGLADPMAPKLEQGTALRRLCHHLSTPSAQPMIDMIRTYLHP